MDAAKFLLDGLIIIPVVYNLSNHYELFTLLVTLCQERLSQSVCRYFYYLSTWKHPFINSCVQYWVGIAIVHDFTISTLLLTGKCCSLVPISPGEQDFHDKKLISFFRGWCIILVWHWCLEFHSICVPKHLILIWLHDNLKLINVSFFYGITDIFLDGFSSLFSLFFKYVLARS